MFAPTAIEALSGASAIGREQLDVQFQADGVSDVLRAIPGMTTQMTSGDTGVAVNIRGLQDFGRVNVLIDGMRQNFQRSSHGPNGVAYIEPEMLQRIDVTRGPTATIYGSGAIGGVAAFEILNADDILRPGETMAMRLRARASSNGVGMLGSATGAAKAGGFDVLGQINGRDVGLMHDGSGNDIINSGERTDSGLVHARWRPAFGHQITSTYIDYYSSFIDATATGGTARDSDLHNRQYNVGYTFARPDSPLLNFSAKVYRNETDLSQINRTGVIGAFRSFSLTTEGVDVSNTSRFDFGGVKMALTYGADAFEDNVQNFDPVGNGDELTPSGRRTVRGAFVQNHLKFWDVVDVIGALRYDEYELNSATTNVEGNRVSPKVTVAVTPLPGVTVFGTYAEGYRAPAVTEALLEGIHPGGFSFVLLPNPDLRPEVAANVEGGINLRYDGVFRPNDAFRAKLVYFHNDVEDYIDGVYSPLPPPFGQYQYQNIANATLEGFEFEAAYDARSWFVGVGAHRIRGTNETDGIPLLTVPADQITLTGGVRTMNDNLVLGGRVRLVAEQNRVPPGAVPSDSFTVVDLFAQYRHTEDLVFNLNIDNVFDETYRVYRDQVNSPGLNARLGVTMRFGG